MAGSVAELPARGTSTGSAMARSPTDTSSVKRVALIAPDGLSIVRQRSGLTSEILKRRHSILALVPEQFAHHIPEMNERGLAAATFPMRGPEPALLADRKSVAAIAALLADWRAHVVLSSGAKTMLLGSMAAKRAEVRRTVGLVTALAPQLMSDDQAEPAWGWRRLMKAGLGRCDAIVFHNEAHRRRVEALQLLKPNCEVQVVNGAGVDLVHHAMQSLPPLVNQGDAALNFAMIARLDAAKGVIEFCEAAAVVKKSAPDTRFILCGPDGDVDRDALSRYSASVEIVADQADVRPLLAAAHVIVLPSWGEAMPRVLLEALATGRPVITTNRPGTRETVDERVNGVLVQPKDVAGLAAAMQSFLRRPDLIPAMARASRSKAERRFGVAPVNTTLLKVLGL